LKKYTIDLTERARLGKLDPVIGPTMKYAADPGAATSHQK